MSLHENAAVELVGVSRLYGSFAAVREVSLKLAAGASVVLRGENGAGKSTVLKLVAGLVQPSYGQVRVWGSPPNALRGRIGIMGHATMLYDELTAMENLVYFAGLYGLGATHAEREAIAASALREVWLEPANLRRLSEYSQGMRQRTALARTLLGQPEVLLLDEPFSNLDIASAQRMVERLMGYLAQPGADGAARTLLLATHQAELARPLARTTVTMQAGRILSVVSA